MVPTTFEKVLRSNRQATINKIFSKDTQTKCSRYYTKQRWGSTEFRTPLRSFTQLPNGKKSFPNGMQPKGTSWGRKWLTGCDWNVQQESCLVESSSPSKFPANTEACKGPKQQRCQQMKLSGIEKMNRAHRKIGN